MSRVKAFKFKGEKLWAEQYLDRATVYDVDGMPFAKLSTYVEGENAPAGFFFCKAYSENIELVDAMIEQEVLIVIGDPIMLPPYGARVLIARLNADHERVQ